MRWTAVIHAVTVRRAMIAIKTQPCSVRPKNACGTDNNYSLRTLYEPDLGIDTETRGTSPSVRDKERADDAEKADHNHVNVVVDGGRRVKNRQAGEHTPVRDAVQRGVVKGAKDAGLACPARHRPVQHVEKCCEGDDPPGRHDMPRGVDYRPGQRAHRPDRRDDIRVHPSPDQKVSDGFNNPKIPSFYSVPERLHRR